MDNMINPSNETKDIDNISSEEIQEIVGYIPHWIITSGISIFLIVISLIVLLCWFIRYPDIIISKVVITTEIAPAKILAHSAGKITLLIKDNQKIKDGEYLALVDNPANYEDVLAVQKFLDSYDIIACNMRSDTSNFLGRQFSLGEIQSSYESFRKYLMDYCYFIETNIYPHRIKSQKKAIEQQKIFYSQALRSLALREAELKLSEKQYSRAIDLHGKRYISEEELENALSNQLSAKSAYNTTSDSLTGIDMTIEQIRDNIRDLEIQYSQEKNKMINDIRNAYGLLRSQITQWIYGYVLKSPIDGTVTFSKLWRNNENVMPGQEVLFVIPDESNAKVLGRVIMPVQGAGKVKSGQIVHIKLYDFPYQQFGVVSGIVRSKSLISIENTYSLEIELPHGLLTDQGKSLYFSQEMQGTCEIVTEDIRLFQRLFKPLLSLAKNYT